MRFIRLIVRRVVRGLGHLDFSMLSSLNGDSSKVPIFFSLFLSVNQLTEEDCRQRKTKKLGHRQLNKNSGKKQPHDKKRQRKTQI